MAGLPVKESATPLVKKLLSTIAHEINFNLTPTINKYPLRRTCEEWVLQGVLKHDTELLQRHRCKLKHQRTVAVCNIHGQNASPTLESTQHMLTI